MSGYDPNFLGKTVPLPEFSPSLIGDVLNKPELTDGVYADYLHYSVATHRKFRTPLFAALNIDQNQLKQVKRSDRWRIDSRIGADYQLNNDYYRSNPWDRGHLARRSSSSWGHTVSEARRASDETFYFSNASLQHANFNQDEWLELENWVLGLTLDNNNKVNSVSGPVFGDFTRTIRPEGREPAMIPAGFFKVVTFINQQDVLETRAFLLMQDAEALADKSGKHRFNFQRYQVSVADIEQLTGLIFPSVVPDSNPLFYNDNQGARDNNNVRHFPERIEVDTADEMTAADTVRETVKDDDIPVFIAAAMVNPKGRESEGEWVSVINLSDDTVDLTDWTLKDPQAALRISGELGAGEAMRIGPLSPIRLANKGGSISLYNAQGERVDRVRYDKQDNDKEGRPVVFNMGNC